MDVIAHLETLIAGVTAGYDELRAFSRRVALEPLAPGALPMVVTTTGIRLDLRLQADWSDEWQFLFFRREDRRPLVEVDLGIGLRPSLRPEPPPAPDVAYRLVRPAFLAAGGGADGLPLVILDGTQVALTIDGLPPPDRTDAARTFRTADASGALLEAMQVEDEPAPAPDVPRDVQEMGQTAFEVFRRTPWTDTSAAWVDPLLRALAAWRRDAEPGEEEPFVSPANGGLQGLLERIGQGMQAIRRASSLNASSASGDREDSELGLLRGPLAIESASVSIRGYLDDAGRVLREVDTRDAPRAAQRVNLHARYRSEAGRDTAVLAFSMPDFLVDGDLQADVIRRLAGDRDTLDAIANAVDGATGETVAAFLGATEVVSGALVVRIGLDLNDRERRRASANLVRVEGPLGGARVTLLLEAGIEIDSSAEKPSVEAVRRARVLAWRRDSQPWKREADTAHAPEYFFRLFRLLQAFQAGIALARHEGRS